MKRRDAGRLAVPVRSIKKFQTAEVLESSKAIFFTSIFCGSAVHNPRVCLPLSTIGISLPIV